MKNHEEINLSNKIKNKIASDKIKMRSKWYFVAEKIGLEGGLFLSILFGIVLICLMLYIMEENGVFEFIEFGFKSWPIILDNVQYDLVLIAVILFIVANIIIKQFDFSYRKPFYIFSCGAIVVVLFAGTFLTFSGASRTLISKLANTELVKNIITDRITKEPTGDKAIVGKIIKVGSDKIYVLAPDGKISEIKMAQKIERPLDMKYDAGQLVKIIVEKSGQSFGAKFIRIVLPNQSNYFQSIPTPTATVYN
jgi:hypothetical protein